jgi:spore maturation protein SpmB
MTFQKTNLHRQNLSANLGPILQSVTVSVAIQRASGLLSSVVAMVSDVLLWCLPCRRVVVRLLIWLVVYVVTVLHSLHISHSLLSMVVCWLCVES